MRIDKARGRRGLQALRGNQPEEGVNHQTLPRLLQLLAVGVTPVLRAAQSEVQMVAQQAAMAIITITGARVASRRTVWPAPTSWRLTL